VPIMSVSLVGANNECLIVANNDCLIGGTPNGARIIGTLNGMGMHLEVDVIWSSHLV